jgi:hypothetical protein
VQRKATTVLKEPCVMKHKELKMADDGGGGGLGAWE